MNLSNPNVINILLVEDNPGDVRLTKEALKEGKIITDLHVVVDGIDALAYLRHEKQYSTAAHPDLILLDLNLPRMNGLEFLGIVKSDPGLRRIPIIILTTSNGESDLIKSYDLHANSYITKPVDVDEFISVVKSIEDFWFTIVKLPPDGELIK